MWPEDSFSSGSAMSTTSVGASNRSLQQQIEVLQACGKNISDAIGQLEERLSPVRLPSPLKTLAVGDATQDKDVEQGSPLYLSLRAVADHHASLVARIRRLSSEVEL